MISAGGALPLLNIFTKRPPDLLHNNFHLPSFINSVTGRETSLLKKDLTAENLRLEAAISGKRVLVIGGGGTIGSSFIHAILRYPVAALTVVDTNENSLTELTRQLRSSAVISVPEAYITYPLSYSSDVFYKLLAQSEPFDIVANFAAHKHVRSEKDMISIEAMLRNNVINAGRLLEALSKRPPAHFFCVSTDKAANPVNVMGASKKLMEHLVLSYADRIKVTTARFANVAFSNGSLLYGFLERISRGEPLSSPRDIKRYFVSPQEAGELCLLACILGQSGDIFFPKLRTEQMQTFSSIAVRLLSALGLRTVEHPNEESARLAAVNRLASAADYPVYFFASDTSGEKPYEEFFTEKESVEMEKFAALGVIKTTDWLKGEETERMLRDMEAFFAGSKTEKSELIALLKRFMPNFAHVEKGKHLDQRM